MSKVAIPIISCSCDEQKLKKLFHLEHSHIRNDDDFDDDDDAMGHGVCQIMTFVDGGGWGSGKTQNKMTSFMNSALELDYFQIYPYFSKYLCDKSIHLLCTHFHFKRFNINNTASLHLHIENMT